MDLGANFAAKLEPYLLMSKSAKGAAAAKLIKDATAAPGVFVFSELLELPNIRELEGTEHEPYLNLLKVFAYKTYQDYQNQKSLLPELNAAQVTKLKHLSIVTYASERRILPYSHLLQTLEMPTVRDLEDLIIDAIYLDVLRGKLDQKESQFEVEYTMGRDLEPGKVEGLLAALQDWASVTASVLTTLDDKISQMASIAASQKLHKQNHEEAVEKTLKEISEKQAQRSSGPNFPRRGYSGSANVLGENRGNDPRQGDLGMNMDVDGPDAFGAKGKNRKAPQESLGKQRKRNRF